MKKNHVYIEYEEDVKNKFDLWNTVKTVKLNDETLLVDALDIDNEGGYITVNLHLTRGGTLTIPDVEITIKKLNVRPDWDRYFLDICKSVAARADCRRAQHGCVIVKDKRIVSTGYNGSPSGGPSCLAGECPRGLLSQEECSSLSSYENCVAIHAEANAIAYASHSDTVGGTLFVTGKQCDMCRKLSMAAGIKRVVWPEGEEVFE